MKFLNLDNPSHFHFWNYNGGEIGCRYNNIDSKVDIFSLEARLNSPNSLVRLILATEVMKIETCGYLEQLDIGYMPYARQDKIHTDGDGLSLKAIANIIDNLGYQKISILDPHSDVTRACFNKTQAQIDDGSFWFKNYIINSFTDINTVVMVIPDVGAYKRCSTWMKAANIIHSVQALKNRDPITGKISNITLQSVNHIDWSKITKIVIADDICDMGGTFLGIAKALQNCGIDTKDRLYLYVSHGIFPETSIENLKTEFKGIGSTNTFKDIDLRYQEQHNLYIQQYFK